MNTIEVSLTGIIEKEKDPDDECDDDPKQDPAK